MSKLFPVPLKYKTIEALIFLFIVRNAAHTISFCTKAKKYSEAQS